MSRLRIIAGEFGGRWIDANVTKATHPMGDRVRMALFSSLESKGVIKGATVLDAFAGTGSLGLEAISRGAKRAVFIERERTAAKLIENNVKLLSVADRAKVINTTVSNWLATSDQTEKYDLIFADPPYKNPQFSTVERLAERLQFKGLMILSYQGRLCVPNQLRGVVVVDTNRSYGEATLAVFQKI